MNSSVSSISKLIIISHANECIYLDLGCVAFISWVLGALMLSELNINGHGGVTLGLVFGQLLICNDSFFF